MRVISRPRTTPTIARVLTEEALCRRTISDEGFSGEERHVQSAAAQSQTFRYVTPGSPNGNGSGAEHSDE
jgi:hypothetical protein